MSEPIISPGEKLHIITRRHFVGEVSRVDGDGFCEVQGYAFVFNASMNRYEQRKTLRTRVFSLGEAMHIVNKLPKGTDVEKLEYGVVEMRLMLLDTTPTSDFKLDINEFNHMS